jgi:hypothetical protein
MQPWSDTPVTEFKIKFFLDTNILSYILDKTHSGITDSIQLLGQSEFVDLVSSRFVIFELAGIRKREHYLRQIVHAQSGTGNVNMSSLLKYRDGFSAPELDFSKIKDQIKQEVESEIETLINIHYIDYKGNLLHDGLLEPTVEVCLSTKISKEDSLVLISALLPEKQKPETKISLITKDKQFTEAYEDFDLEPIFKSFSLTKPLVEHIKGISLSDGTTVNLTLSTDDARLPAFWIDKIKEMIIEKNKHLYLGKTMAPHSPGKLPQNCVCFKLNANTDLPKNIVVTFISNSLDFIYSTKVAIEEFWNNARIETYPYSSQEIANIAFLANEKNDNNDLVPIDLDIVQRLREENHLVFIHPDSYLA